MVHLRLFIFISLKVQYSHESALGMWTSLLKHVAAEKRLRTAYVHILYIHIVPALITRWVMKMSVFLKSLDITKSDS